ncbi:hypothetical protein J8TS2_43250 [Lederbergia ruris]|uniref:Uncharacterized protein n=1 Tax=Lederbergia ruris TaxID=217495 RepID=A0ABQ4KPZ4_9BACI|nr:hypothetical protein J8TS2_43250 [Lederbergia ruris]
MNDFYTILNYVNKMIYEPNDLTVNSVQEEKQNSRYGAGTFRLSSRTVRFRVAIYNSDQSRAVCCILGKRRK